METRRGTTPEIVCTIDGIPNLEVCDTIWITMKQGSLEITKEKGDLTISGNEASFTLSQEETLKFNDRGNVSIQLRALIGSEAVASDIRTFSVGAILKDSIIK